MTIVTYIATGKQSIKELCLSIKTLDLWNKDITVYIATDSISYPLISHLITERPYPTHIITSLDKYSGLTRSVMERMPGISYKCLFTDYTFEKTNIINYAFKNESDTGIWFMDADIIHFGPLPEIPDSANIALSPHYIKDEDCNKFGIYNAGFLWIKNPEYLNIWRLAGHTSKFFEQFALNTVAESAKIKNELYEFGDNINFGWWRMFQASESSDVIKKRFSIFRHSNTSGINYNGKYLASIHTHLNDQILSISQFNKWILLFLSDRLAKHHPPAYKLLQLIK